MFYLSLLCIYLSFFLPMALNQIGIQKGNSSPDLHKMDEKILQIATNT